MAKRRNKASKIREFLAERPDASAKEVVAALAAQRIRVTPAQVYNIKSISSKPGKPGRLKASGYDSLVQAKKLADAMGGIDEARRALDVLAKLI